MVRESVGIVMSRPWPAVDLEVIGLEYLQSLDHLPFWLFKMHEPGQGGMVSMQKKVAALEAQLKVLNC